MPSGTYYVSPSGDNTNGLTWETAWQELSGINWALVLPGNTVNIGPGTYQTTLTIGASGTDGAPIRIVGSAGAVIDGGLTYWPCGATTASPYTSEHPAGTRSYGIDINGKAYIDIAGPLEVKNHNVAGVTLRYGQHINLSGLHIHHNTYARSPDGPGINISGTDVTIDGVDIHDNGQDALQGPAVNGLVLRNSYLHGHTCSHPDGIQLYGPEPSSGIIIEGNHFDGFMQAVFLGEKTRADASASNVTVRYNIIHGAQYGVVPYHLNSRTWQVHNNTIVDTLYSALHFYHVSTVNQPTLEAYNNIVVGVDHNTFGASAQHHNLFWQMRESFWYGGVGSFYADPLFVDRDSDYHLLPGSPARGTGLNGEDLGAFE